MYRYNLIPVVHIYNCLHCVCVGILYTIIDKYICTFLVPCAKLIQTNCWCYIAAFFLTERI